MKAIPDSRRTAEAIISHVAKLPLPEAPESVFVQAWWAILYLNPGLHPDGFEERDSGWSPELRPFAAEAWRRFEQGQLVEEELYPADAAWAALYDGAEEHTPGETQRRLHLRELRLPLASSA